MSAGQPCAIERPGYSIASNNRIKRKSRRRNANNKANDVRKSSSCARDFDKDSVRYDGRNNAVQNIFQPDSLQNPQDSHYNDVMMSTMASQIAGLTIVYSNVDSDSYQRKHQSSASLAFVGGIHRSPVNSPHKRPVTRKIHLMTSSWITENSMYNNVDSG